MVLTGPSKKFASKGSVGSESWTIVCGCVIVFHVIVIKIRHRQKLVLRATEKDEKSVSRVV